MNNVHCHSIFLTDADCIVIRSFYLTLTKTLKMSQNNMMDYKTDLQK